jgi:hypothetical protein
MRRQGAILCADHEQQSRKRLTMNFAKMMLAAALLATPLSLWAQDAAPAADKPAMEQGMTKPDLNAMKAKMAERKAKMDADIAAQRAKLDEHRNACAAKAQAADTPEAMRAIMKSCHEEGKAMHQAHKGQHQAKKAEWKEKREGMQAEREAKRAAKRPE